jgi:hypothetical protein
MSPAEEPSSSESKRPTRRTVLALLGTALSFGIAVIFEREIFYRGYGEDGYGEQGFGG